MTTDEEGPLVNSQPIWKTRMLERLNDIEASTDATTGWGGRLVTRITPQFMAMLHRAASARGLTIGGYVRRAVSKQLATDLGVPISQVLRISPYPGPYGGGRLPAEFYRKGRNGRVAVPDDGTGYGDWEW